MQPINDNLLAILNTRFGFESFRPGQLEAITTLLTQGRLLCIHPTGHGKSLLYQLPSVVLNGMTLVISPLLALMRDQLVQLNQRFNLPAAAINSDQSDSENFVARNKAKSGQIKILFVAPEQLDDLERFDFLLALPISLIVIDEAHCISTWGHDFRPSYRQILKLVQTFEKKNAHLKILGLTATANKKTETDIKQQLSSDQPIAVHRASMDRANIQLAVIAVHGLANKLALLVKLFANLNGDGLIYCATRENTELVAEYLQLRNINAAAYHAGFEPDEKRQLQHAFMQGKYQVIVATNALGMGIDKPNLRFIIHFDIPGSITAYYQEVGRSGRDGLPAQGILLFDEQDKKIQQYFIDAAEPTEKNFTQILTAVANAPESPAISAIKQLTGLHPTLVTVVVAELVEQHLLRKIKHDKQVYQCTGSNHQPDLTRYKNQYQIKTAELNNMLHYGEQRDVCRMVLLRQTLGDEDAKPCGHCDLCAQKSHAAINVVPQLVIDATHWLNKRAVNLKASRIYQVSAGVALLDGKLRAPAFVQFMQQRAYLDHENYGLNKELLLLLEEHLARLTQQHHFSAIIPVPSRTWKNRDLVAQLIAVKLNIPVLSDVLVWRTVPLNRQGELFNNDQRQHNVDKKMTLNKNCVLPKGAILLLDDYLGSGATIKEAARVLRKEANLKQPIIPFVIAAVKWRMGQAGMI